MTKKKKEAVSNDKTQEMESKLDSTLQHMTKIKDMLLQGERPKDIAAELNISVSVIRAIITASDIDTKDIFSLRQFRPKRAVFYPNKGIHKFVFWVVLPKEIKTYRVEDITEDTITIKMTPK